MSEALDYRLPSFGRVRDHLVHEELRTSTLSVCVFTVALPAATFFVDLLLQVFRRKAGIPVSEAVGNTLWPTIISVLVSVLAWSILLGWSFIKLIKKDKQALVSVIAQKDTYIQQLGEIMGKRAEESAATINQHVRTIWEREERIRQINAQLSLTEGELYSTKTQLTNERDRIAQPDVALVWDWPEDERMRKALSGDSERDILVHNRSNQFVYNVQIETVPLRNGLTFEIIPEIPPNTQCKAVGRWNDKSSLTSNYGYFFVGGEDEAEEKGWICQKLHNRGASDSYYKIPMAISYESGGVRWKFDFEFTYDLGWHEPTFFTKKSGQRIN
jgi:hypothetical protein